MNLTPLGPAPAGGDAPTAYHSTDAGVGTIYDADASDDGQIYVRYNDASFNGNAGVFAMDSTGTLVTTSVYEHTSVNGSFNTNLAVNKTNGDVAWGGGAANYIYTESDMSTGFESNQGCTNAFYGGSIINRFVWLGNDLYSMKALYSNSVSTGVTTPCVLKHTISTGAISSCKFVVANSADTGASATRTSTFSADSSYTYTGSRSTTYRWICKRNTLGNLVWSRRGYNNGTYANYGFCVIDDSSNVYASWTSNGNFWLTKFDSSGTEQYTVQQSGTWPTYGKPGSDMGATVANGTLVMSFRRNSGNGVAIMGINALDGSVDYYYEITDNSTGANSYEQCSIGKNPDETFIYVCSGKTVFALPADGSITPGTYGDYVVTANTTPTTVSGTTVWISATLSGITDSTNYNTTRSTQTVSLTNLGVTPLS